MLICLARGVFWGGGLGHVSTSPPPPTAVGAVDGEAIFRLLRPKKGQRKFSSKIFRRKGKQKFSSKCSQKRSTKIAIVTGGTLSTPLPLGNNLGLSSWDCPPWRFSKYAAVRSLRSITEEAAWRAVELTCHAPVFNLFCHHCGFYPRPILDPVMRCERSNFQKIGNFWILPVSQSN